MAVTTTTPIELVDEVYGRLRDRVALGRERLGRPLTFAEKALLNHLRDPHGQPLERGRSSADFDPDRVAMQDATAQMALLQFMTAGLPQVAAAQEVVLTISGGLADAETGGIVMNVIPREGANTFSGQFNFSGSDAPLQGSK